jgi:two-component system response regulator MprA
MQPVVVVAEDDDQIREILIEGLRDDGFAASGVATGAALMQRVAERGADALIVDIGLPDADGRDVCQALRAAGLETPILFLTALDALPDRISAFRAGGDDYVTKPFALAEIVERLRALLRRTNAAALAIQACGVVLDPTSHTVAGGGTAVVLTPTEFRLLGALLAAPGAIVRRRTLKEAGWPHGALVNDNMLDVFMTRLRRKLRQLPAPPQLVTHPGVGYTIAP